LDIESSLFLFVWIAQLQVYSYEFMSIGQSFLKNLFLWKKANIYWREIRHPFFVIFHLSNIRWAFKHAQLSTFFGIGQLPPPGYATAQLQTIDLFKMYISLLIERMVYFCISFFHHLIRFIKKTKYTARCSVQSSTIYKVKFILMVYFLFSNKAKFSANAFRSVEIWSRRIFVDFEHKKYNCKITCRI